MAPPKASVLIPTRNPGPVIERTLESVFSQRAPFDFEVIIVDSSSHAIELKRLERFPVRLYCIAQTEFGQGRTRNQLATLANGELFYFLSQDAVPVGDQWMAALASPLSKPEVAGAYARQVAPDWADPMIRFFLSETYPERPTCRSFETSRPTRLQDIFFSNVSSVVRRDVWERIPFRNVSMSEDQWWAKDVLSAGFGLAYEPAAVVTHEQTYSLRSLILRNLISGGSLRGLVSDAPAQVLLTSTEYVWREARQLIRHGQWKWLPHMFAYEIARHVSFAVGALGFARTPRANER